MATADRTQTLESLKALVQGDLDQLARTIDERLQSEVSLIPQIAGHLVAGGGKRIRPLVLLLGGQFLGQASERHVLAAAVIEFIHTATLLHDDVVDASTQRRGRLTANAIWGNQASVLVGDFLYSRAFEMMVDIGNMRVMALLATTTNTIARGEVMQLLNCHDADTSEARYFEIIDAKTAILFEATARLPAILAGQPEAVENAMGHYGRHLGRAFQLVDDILDYEGDHETLGKNLGDDLAEGKPTLPVIHALCHGSEAQKQLLRGAIEHGNAEQIDEVRAAIESAGSLAYTAARAEAEIALALAALQALPDSRWRQALSDLARFATRRDR